MSVVVIGLNHRTVPLDLLERMTRRRAAPAQGAARPRAAASTSPRPSCCRPATAPRSTRSPSASTAPTQTSATSSPSWPSCAPEEFADHLYVHYDDERRRAPVRGGRRARLGGARRERDPRPGARGLGAGPGRGRGRAAAQPAVPPRARGRQAGPHRDRHRPRHVASVSHAAVAMAADRLGSLERPRRPGARRRRDGRGHGRGPGRRRRRRRPRRQPHLERADGAGRPRRRPGRAASPTSPAALADVDLLLTSTGAHSMLLEHADLAPVHRRPATAGRCSSSTSPCRATSTPASA